MVENAYLVDSSVFVAFYISDDSCHEDAVAVLQEIDSSTLFLHPYVIQEVATVLTYKSGVTLAKKFIKDIQQATNSTILPTDVMQDMKHFTSLSKKVSFTDSSLLATAKR